MLTNHPNNTTYDLADSEYGNGVLFRSGKTLFSILRDSDEGWSYTIFEKDPMTSLYDTPSGGFIDDARGCTIHQVAQHVADIISDEPVVPEMVNLPISVFLESVKPHPVFTYRSVNVFCDPILRGNGESLSSEMIGIIKQLIDERLGLSILLSRRSKSGKYNMSLISKSVEDRFSDDEPFVMVERPDGTEGRLIYDSSVFEADVDPDYDIAWAIELWMEPVYINWHIDGPWIE